MGTYTPEFMVLAQGNDMQYVDVRTQVYAHTSYAQTKFSTEHTSVGLSHSPNYFQEIHCSTMQLELNHVLIPEK